MKRLLLLGSLLVALFAVGGTGFASTASAANCTQQSIGPVVYDGSWYFQSQLAGCTGVSGVRWLFGNQSYTYIYDATRQVFHYSYTPNYDQFVTSGSYAAIAHWSIWGTGCGNAAFTANKFVGFQLRNSNGGTLGPPHQMWNSQLLC